LINKRLPGINNAKMGFLNNPKKDFAFLASAMLFEYGQKNLFLFLGAKYGIFLGISKGIILN